MTSPFLDILQPISETQTFDVPANWGQGRATFGGLVGAAAARGAEHLANDRRLLSMQGTFAGPLAPGGAAQTQAELIREGRAATMVHARVVQGDKTPFVANLCFGTHRDSEVRVESPPAPEIPPPDQFQSMPYVEGITPAFTQFFEFRFTTPYPFTGAEEARILGWCRLRESPEGPASLPELIALTDSWPAPILPTMRRPAPASSVTWQINFLHPATRPASEWWLYQSEAEMAADGYCHMQATLWDPQGLCTVRSSQLVAIFD